MAADLQQTIERWSSSGATGQQRYQEGVANTTVDVVARAIAAEGALVANFSQAVSSGRWRRGLQANGGTAYWKQQTQAKASNWSTGISAGRDKYANAMQTWFPRIQSAAQQARNMPGGTFAERMARATAYATTLHNQKIAG